MVPIGSPETSVSNHLAPCKNPENEIIQFNSAGCLRSRKIFLVPNQAPSRKGIPGYGGTAPCTKCTLLTKPPQSRRYPSNKESLWMPELWTDISGCCRESNTHFWVNNERAHHIQGGSNMTGTICVYTSHSLSRSYLNHLVYLDLQKV